MWNPDSRYGIPINVTQVSRSVYATTATHVSSIALVCHNHARAPLATLNFLGLLELLGLFGLIVISVNRVDFRLINNAHATYDPGYYN